jgi:hypothetical protein
MRDKTSSPTDAHRFSVIFDSLHPKDYLAIRQLGQRCRDHGVDKKTSPAAVSCAGAVTDDA